MADEKNEAPADEAVPASGDEPTDVIDGDVAEPVIDDADAAEEADADADAEVSTDKVSTEKVSTAKVSTAKGKVEPDDDDEEAEPAKPVSEAKKKADAVIAQRNVTRRTVTSKRVTPKAGTKVEAGSTPSKARNAKVTEQINARYTPPTPTYEKGPSPWWVPAIMFGLLIVGALIIMLNYMGVFGDAENLRLVIGLGFILGGIITATQYR